MARNRKPDPDTRYNDYAMDLLNEDSETPAAESTESAGGMAEESADRGAKPGDVRSVNICRIDNGYEVTVNYVKFPAPKDQQLDWDQRKPKDLTLAAKSEEELHSLIEKYLGKLEGGGEGEEAEEAEEVESPDMSVGGETEDGGEGS